MVWENLCQYRNSALEYTKNELDLVIKVQLQGHRHTGGSTDSKKHKSEERERIFQEYSYLGNRYAKKRFVLLMVLQ